MKRTQQIIACFLFGASFLVVPGGSAVADESDDEGIKIGSLKCKSVPGTRLNLLLYSTEDIRCRFRDLNGNYEYYKGDMGINLGVDLKIASKSELVFTVYAQQYRKGSHMLSGRYTGASASATTGTGIGAHLLVGGNDNSIGLRPAIEASKGFGAAAGLGFLNLEKYVPKKINSKREKKKNKPINPNEW